jgi:hypothetical protein
MLDRRVRLDSWECKEVRDRRVELVPREALAALASLASLGLLEQPELKEPLEKRDHLAPSDKLASLEFRDHKVHLDQLDHRVVQVPQAQLVHLALLGIQVPLE